MNPSSDDHAQPPGHLGTRRVWHSSMMPERADKCDVLIVIPKRDELRSAASIFDLHPDTPDRRLDDNQECWSTIVAELRVQVLLADSQGSAEVALATASALKTFDPAVALCIGTAAGREGETSYLDVVLATAVLDATEWRTKPGALLPQWSKKTDATVDVASDIDLFVKNMQWREDAARRFSRALKHLEVNIDVANATEWPRVKDAWIVTSAFLHEDPEFLKDVWALNARLRAIDMESAGFVSACVQPVRPCPWVVLRAVSDHASKDSKLDSARPAAGAAAAVIARLFIEHGLKRSHPVRLDAPEAAEPAISAENFFARLTMGDFLCQEIPRRFNVPFDERTVSHGLTVDDLAVLCGTGPDIARALDELRESYFTSKYKDYDDEADVRQLTGPTWAQEVTEIYEYLGIALSQADILYVGVGNGRDLPLVCPKFDTLTGVDLSTVMLAHAATVMPAMTTVRDRAETLEKIPDGSVDLYLSLRVYQSSLFDAPAALRQAFRVLRPGGGLVLSIPGGYLDRSNGELRYLPGLLVPGTSNVVDRGLPRRLAEMILAQIDRMTFSHVGFHQREGDVYVYARKC
jgi:nucleoside phosphorylase/SAM-dependent methyltransferase